MKVGMKRPSPAMVIAVAALVIALAGTAYAALPKNSVGSRQLKTRAVTTSKFADGAVKGEKVAKKTLTGEDINLAELGRVPSSESAGGVVNAETLTGHPAACPGGTVAIRGLCWDAAPSGPILGVENAADACAARGGYLPTPELAVSVRKVIPLGDGSGEKGEGVNWVYTDSYFGNTSGVQYRETIVSSTDEATVENRDEKPPAPTKKLIANYKFVCVYHPVHTPGK